MTGQTILVIEDNPLNMQLMTAILDGSGYAVLQAGDAQAGLELARRELPALIFMDIQLPGMDGLSATRLLKDDPQTCGIPVIAVTAYAMTGDRERILAAGCDDYLSKPVSYKDVLDMVERVLATPSPPTPLPQGERGDLAPSPLAGEGWGEGADHE